jgi:hypothetical protein
MESKKFFISVTKNKNKNIYNIFWPVRYINKNTLGALSREISAMKLFKRLSNDIIHNLSKKYKTSRDVVINIHRTTVENKAINSVYKIKNNIRNMVKDYNEESIDVISYKYDIPPLMLLRSILIEKGYSSTALYGIFSGKIEPETELHGYDLKQFHIANDNDISNFRNQQKVGKKALLAEEYFITKFKKLNINFKTQNDLMAEQTKLLGRPVLTPDLLILDTVYINGKKINWIDFKSYTLLPDTFIFSSVLKQAKKYNEYFGSGALVFQHGLPYVNIPKTLVLDADALYQYC